MTETLHGTTIPTELPGAERAYLAELVATLRDILGDQLLGAYLFGSAGYGAYEPGRSDLDVQAVTAAPLSHAASAAIVARLGHTALPCPAQKLELVCYPRAAISPATRHPRFDLNFNTGRTIAERVTRDPAGESSHWFLLDIAMGRELGWTLLGPEPSALFGPIPRRWQLEGIAQSLAWHQANEQASANSVLNACRGWRYALTDTWGSKAAGAEWACQEQGCPPVVAEAARAGESAMVERTDVAALTARIADDVAAALQRELAAEGG